MICISVEFLVFKKEPMIYVYGLSSDKEKKW